MNFIHKISSIRYRLAIGTLIWILWTGAHFSFPLHPNWGRMLLLLAPLAVVPMGLNLISDTPFFDHSRFMKTIEKWMLPAALCLVLAYCFDQGKVAGLLALPWLSVTLAVAWAGISAVTTRSGNSTQLALSTGMVYLSVGGSWALVDRMGLRPLAFDSEIVFLTVAHFHYAGFVLPLVSGLVYNKIQNWLAKAMVWGILSGVLLVAAGIVNSQLGNSPALESFAAWWLALSAILLAILQIKIALKKGTPLKVALCFSVAGAALIGGMLLAGLYGLRHVFPIPGLNIPMMWALHGSANVFGFSVFAVMGWRYYKQVRPKF